MCLLHTMADAYRVLQLQQRPLSAREAFFRITKGNARVLQLEGEIGDLGLAAQQILCCLIQYVVEKWSAE